MKETLSRAIIGLGVCVAALASCGAPGPDRERILLVTTTSVEASGLLEEILTSYHAAQNRYRLAPTAVGSGAALEIARRGDADVLLTHDPRGERAFATAGHAVDQGPVMMNDFVVVGPGSDPASLGASAGPVDAFRRLGEEGVRFLSRGDDSGTHARERELWDSAGLSPWTSRPPWYVEAGTGMAETLQMASQLGAYTLTDRGTFLHLRQRLRLQPLVEGGPVLENHYTYTVPRNSGNPEGARDFLAWLTGPGQGVIADYGVALFGEPLFRPTAGG
ncbi:MAG TPA: substrate-binding domain-containing protein [Longimicrobiales bacterium]|nr:substrate-binding domain-containing protein [Longimicrobiales bacterium]